MTAQSKNKTTSNPFLQLRDHGQAVWLDFLSRRFIAEGGLQKLIELEVVVAERAGNGRAPGEVLAHEGADHVGLEALFLVDDVVGNAEVLGDTARIVDIIERAATRRQRLAVFIHTDAAPLVPQLHREADEFVTLLFEDGGGRGRIDAT